MGAGVLAGKKKKKENKRTDRKKCYEQHNTETNRRPSIVITQIDRRSTPGQSNRNRHRKKEAVERNNPLGFRQVHSSVVDSVPCIPAWVVPSRPSQRGWLHPVCSSVAKSRWVVTTHFCPPPPSFAACPACWSWS